MCLEASHRLFFATPAAHKARLNSEIDRLGKLLEAAGIKPEE